MYADFWTSGSDGSWGVGANWNNGVVPSGVVAGINQNATTRIVTLTGVQPSPTEINIATGNANVTATLNSSGTIDTTGGVRVGNGSATRNGTLNITGGSFTSDGSLVMGANTGSGTLLVSGGTVDFGKGATGGTAFNNIGQGGTGFAEFTGGTTNFDWLALGNDHASGGSGTASVSIAGGTVNTTVGDLYIGHGTALVGGSSATLNISSGTLSAVQNLRLASEFSTGAATTGRLIMSGGTVDVGSSFNVANETASASNVATFAMSGGTFTANNIINFANTGTGTLNQTGGTIRGLSFTNFGHNTGGSGTLNVTGSAASFESPNQRIGLGVAGGSGTINISAGKISSSQLGLANGSAAGGLGEVNQTGGTVSVNNVTLSSGSGGTGTYNLDGGTLRVDTISTAQGAGKSNFNWGAGTLSPRTLGSAGDGDDSSPGFNSVDKGNTLTINPGANSISTSGSTLDLGGLYINSGTRYSSMRVNGNLNLTGSDTLVFSANPYNLRPNIGTAIESGSLLLVDTDTKTGTFLNFTGPVQDNIGWSEYTGVFTSAALLPTNTYYFQETGTQVFFHYNVEGTVPEPGSMILLGFGVVCIRSVRRLLRRR